MIDFLNTTRYIVSVNYCPIILKDKDLSLSPRHAGKWHFTSNSFLYIHVSKSSIMSTTSV